ncbi:MAG TPA: hypothetical protein VGX69_07980 [Solirubrobacteraceae bacterium]|nr:hypothetical protein [Solirubrobacteraceae bacterium]
MRDSFAAAHRASAVDVASRAPAAAGRSAIARQSACIAGASSAISRRCEMNRAHGVVCSSAWWARTVERELLPWALGDVGRAPVAIAP